MILFNFLKQLNKYTKNLVLKNIKYKKLKPTKQPYTKR